jgi:hypothetical protein
MAQELFVDLRYRGIELGRRLQFDCVAASEAYLHAPAPMPVGTLLTIGADDELEVTIRVTRVSEQVAGADRPAGMFVEPFELTDQAQDRWDAWARGEGAPAAAVAEPVESPQEPPVANADSSSASAAAEPPLSPSEVAADAEPAGKQKGKNKKKRSRPKKAK